MAIFSIAVLHYQRVNHIKSPSFLDEIAIIRGDPRLCMLELLLGQGELLLHALVLLPQPLGNRPINMSMMI